MKKLFLKLKNKIKTPQKNCVRNLYLATLISITIGLVLTALLLANNLIATLKSSEKVILLKKEIASETFDINEFNQALAALNKKINPSEKIDWSKIKNIFLEPGQPQNLQAPLPANELNDVSPR